MFMVIICGKSGIWTIQRIVTTVHTKLLEASPIPEARLGIAVLSGAFWRPSSEPRPLEIEHDDMHRETSQHILDGSLLFFFLSSS